MKMSRVATGARPIAWLMLRVPMMVDAWSGDTMLEPRALAMTSK